MWWLFSWYLALLGAEEFHKYENYVVNKTVAINFIQRYCSSQGTENMCFFFLQYGEIM